MSANTYGRQVVLPLTNKSGGGVVAGDVVILDTTNNDAFTTTTSASFTGPVGIAQETIASNAVGRVLFGGYAALVNVNASVTRGHFGATFTVAKQATDGGASRTAGTFCQFLTGGTTPDAMLWPTDLLGSSLTNPMTTKGDIILGDTGGTPTRLGASSTSGYVLTGQGAGAFPAWAAPGGGYGTLIRLYGWDDPAVTASTGTWVFNGSQWADMGANGPYVGYGWYNSSSAQNDALTWTLFLPAGTYSVAVRGRKSSNTAIATFKIDGSSIGTLDSYAAAPAYWKAALTGAVIATGGSHTLQMIAATKNGSSSNYLLNLFDITVFQTA